MSIETSTALFFDDMGTVSIAELAELSGLTEDELAALVDCGALAPAGEGGASWTFSASCIVTARTARRLRDDLALDEAHAVALVLRLMQRIEALELELRARR
ncbi:MAG TPA: chaperone modulator CbpM [Casimicrobiaceae bacterium]